MKCPACQLETLVIDSRPQGDIKLKRRRRRCPGCELRFTTYEVHEDQLPLLRRNNGRVNPTAIDAIQTTLRQTITQLERLRLAGKTQP